MNLKYGTIMLASSLLLVTACATKKEPTLGEIMKTRGVEAQEIGVNWEKGQKLIKEGKAKIKKGKALVDDGEDLIDDGEDMLEEGEDLVEESEAASEKLLKM